MLSFVLTRQARSASTFYRVAVEYNLFGEYSVLREWGQLGRHGAQSVAWYSNLRDACFAADHLRRRALRRGYQGSDVTAGPG